VHALRNAARKRDMLDTSGAMSQHPAFRQSPTTSPDNREPRTPFRSMSRPELFRSASGPVSAANQMSPPSSPPPGVQNFSRLSKHPASVLPADTGAEEVTDKSGSAAEPSINVARVTSASNTPGTRRTVDEMTKLLDEMIQDKVNTGHVIRGDRGSLRVKRDTVMSRAGNEDDMPSHDAEAGATALHHEKPQFI
jgi:centromeric protein E